MAETVRLSGVYSMADIHADRATSFQLLSDTPPPLYVSLAFHSCKFGVKLGLQNPLSDFTFGHASAMVLRGGSAATLSIVALLNVSVIKVSLCSCDCLWRSCFGNGSMHNGVLLC